MTTPRLRAVSSSAMMYRCSSSHRRDCTGSTQQFGHDRLPNATETTLPYSLSTSTLEGFWRRQKLARTLPPVSSWYMKPRAATPASLAQHPFLPSLQPYGRPANSSPEDLADDNVPGTGPLQTREVRDTLCKLRGPSHSHVHCECCSGPISDQSCFAKQLLQHSADIAIGKVKVVPVQ